MSLPVQTQVSCGAIAAAKHGALLDVVTLSLPVLAHLILLSLVVLLLLLQPELDGQALLCMAITVLWCAGRLSIVTKRLLTARHRKERACPVLA